MVKGAAKYKVPGGKLISIKVEFTDSIESVQILGDFFLHPEESISDIEKAVIGSGSDESEAVLSAKIKSAAESSHAEMIGVSPDSIATAIKLAIKNGMESN